MFWKAVTKVWQPSATKCTKEAVTCCAGVGWPLKSVHKASIKFKSVQTNRPFNIECFDIWCPLKILSKGGRGTPPCQAVLAGVDIVTNAAMVDGADVARCRKCSSCTTKARK